MSELGSGHDELRPRQTLTGRLQRILLIGILVGLVLASTIAFFGQQATARKQLVEDLRAVASLLGNRSVAAIIFYDQDAATRNLASAEGLESVHRLCLYDARGELFSQFRSATTRLPPCDTGLDPGQRLDEVIFTAGHVQIVLPITDRDETIARIRIDGGLEHIREHMVNDLLALAAASLIACLLAFLLTRVQLRRVLAPLEDLHRHTRRISSGELALDDPSRDALSSPFNDEIHDLITAYKRMIGVIHDEQMRVQDSESRFRSLAENSPVGIFLYTASGELSYFNRRWSEMTGCDALGRHAEFVERIHPDDRDRYRETLRQALGAGEAARVEYRLGMPGDEAEHVFIDYLSPIVGDGRAVAVIGSCLEISELKAAQQKLSYMAYHDALTDLPNRRFFRMHLDVRIAAAMKAGRRLSLLLIDLDNFKNVNDLLGHDAGDELLKIISGRFRGLALDQDFVSRLGGDEFVILVEQDDSDEFLAKLTQDVLDATHLPTEIQDHRIEISCSVGVARFPDHGQARHDLMRHADIAMYHAKKQGKDHAELFSPQMSADIQRRILLERKLRDAIRDYRLEIHIQPQFDVNRGGFFWAEALARWFDREEKMVPPDLFISIAEESNLIAELDDCVFRQVCELLSAHRAELESIGIEGISVNVSAQEFYGKDLIPNLTRTMEEFGVSPRSLELELTESLVMQDVESASLAMDRLRAMGFTLALDDFGTGHSSLAHLKRFSIDRLKIDKSFVEGLPDDPNDVAIANAILAMAQELSLEVIAEGVETKAQSQFLAAKNCTQMQGYLYARPMPIEDLLALAVPGPATVVRGANPADTTMRKH